VRHVAVGLVVRAVADDSLDPDERGLVRARIGRRDRLPPREVPVPEERVPEGQLDAPEAQDEVHEVRDRVHEVPERVREVQHEVQENQANEAVKKLVKKLAAVPVARTEDTESAMKSCPQTTTSNEKSRTCW